MTAATRHGLRDVVVGAEQQPLHAAVGPVVVGLVAVEPVGAEQRPLDEPARRSRRRRGEGPPSTASRYRARAARPWATAGGDPGALGVELARDRRGRPGSSARPSAWVSARCLNSRRASPVSSSALERAAGEIVSDALVLEHADDDRVGAGVGRILWSSPAPPRRTLATAGTRIDQLRRIRAPPTTRRSSIHAQDRDPRQPPALRSARSAAALASLDATELGGTAIKAALERAEVGAGQVQHVVMGQVLQAGQGQIPSRQAQIKGGIPKEVSSETINKVCASGMRAAGAARRGDPRRRPRGRRRRRHGVDVERAVPAQAGPLRLPDGRRARRSTR